MQQTTGALSCGFIFPQYYPLFAWLYTAVKDVLPGF